MYKVALMLPSMGLGDQICLIPSLKKLKERFGKFDILYSEPFHLSNPEKMKFCFYDEAEYIMNYRHTAILNRQGEDPREINGEDKQGERKNKHIILYDELKCLPQPAVWELLTKPEHISILFLKLLNLEYNEETPEKEIEIKLPKDRVDKYAKFNDYYVIAPTHINPYWGRWFDLNVYSELVKRFKNIKFISLYNLPLPYETKTFWADDLDQLQFFLKSVRGVVTVDSSIQHYCKALGKKALVLWGYGERRVKGFGYKSHINIFRESNDFYDDIINDTHMKAGNIDYYIRKDIDYEIFFEGFEKLIKETS